MLVEGAAEEPEGARTITVVLERTGTAESVLRNRNVPGGELTTTAFIMTTAVATTFMVVLPLAEFGVAFRATLTREFWITDGAERPLVAPINGEVELLLTE